jgi:hypothetical protein
VAFAEPEVIDSNKENESSLANELFGGEQPATSEEAWDPVILSSTKGEVHAGLKEELRSALLSKHQLKGELTCLGPPKLNREVISALSKRQSIMKRDDYQVKAQEQVGACLNALGTGVSELLKARRDLSAKEREALAKVADGMHLLSDHQYRLSLARRAFIKPCLAYVGKSAADHSTVDDWLFGSTFADEVKSAQALEKTGRELSGSVRAPAALPKVTHQPIKRQPAQHASAQRSGNSKVPAQRFQTKARQTGTTHRTSRYSRRRSRSRSRARR